MARRACATRPREGPPGHRCHCAARISPHFRDCGRPTVCRRGGRIRMRPPRRQTASAIPGGAPANPDARQPRGQRHRHRHLLQQLQQHKVAGSEASRRAAEPPRTRATQHPASGSQLRVRKTLPRLARVTRRSGAAAQPPETATTASIRARDLAANSRGFLNQPNAAGGRKNRGSGLVRPEAQWSISSSVASPALEKFISNQPPAGPPATIQ